MSIITPWTSPPPDLPSILNPGSVHIWRISLNDSPERAYRFRNYLSEDEKLRADRCRSPHPQYQFVVTRGLLRKLLSRYLDVQPADLTFTTQSHGKPILVTPHLFPIQFNVSHTRGMALIAVTIEQMVGIDVEWIDRKIQDHDIAERYFSSRESAYLSSLPPAERTRRFFSYWTCKEAYFKMLGKGITGGLAQCELFIQRDQPKVNISPVSQKEQKEEYSLYQLAVGEEHVGAMCLSCHSPQISYWTWMDDLLS